MIIYDLIFSIVLILLSLFILRKKPPSDIARKAIILLSLFAGFRYIYWRASHSLNFSDVPSSIISVTLFLAELYALSAWVMFYVQVFKQSQRPKNELREDDYTTVDIFITVYNEPIEILYKTVVSTLAVDYPSQLKKVYILDDGHREKVRQLADELGCIYIMRPNNENAKAGNINYGLKHSKGHLIMMLDCDHIPGREFLKKTLGYFRDPKVGFVQTAHYFYNPDIFQRNLRLEKEIANDQDLFFRVMQPGKDSYNASFFAGSNAVFRRSVLQEIGGFQTKTLTEDLHTSMEVHSKGYKSVYINEVLTAGLAPESYRGFLRQRQRWTRGAIQVFLLDNPLLKKGLSFMQRINYLGSNFYFFNGWARIIYLISPLSYLMLNIAPLTAPVPDLLVYFVPYFAISLMTSNAIGKGHTNPFWSDVYETVMCFFISWTAIETFLRPEKKNFRVTPKGLRFERNQLEWSFVMPHIVLWFHLIVGFGIAGFRFWNGDQNRNGLLISGFWGFYNLLIVTTAIVLARERKQKRSTIRVPKVARCEIIYKDLKLQGQTADLSETGLSALIQSKLPPFLPSDEKVRIIHSSPRLNQPARRLILPPDATIRIFNETGEVTEIKGETIRYDLLPSGQYCIGFKFLRVTEQQKQGIIRQIYNNPGLWENIHRKTPSTWSSFLYLLTSPYRVFIKGSALRRFSPRVSQTFKCELVTQNGVFVGQTENVSYKGLSVRVKTNVILPREVKVLIYWKSLILRVRGEIVHFTKTKGEKMVYGIRFIDSMDPEIALFLSDRLK